jgi:MFS family permease
MQGFGASGLYALCMVIFFELVPPSKFAAYSGLVASVFALSLLFGPIWGGAIVKSSTWRWVFLFKLVLLGPADPCSMIVL